MTVDLKSAPAAPGRLPLLGHAVPLLRRPLAFLQTLKDAGDLVRVDIGTMPVYFVTTAELTHELLVTKARFFDKGRFFDRARILVGDGLVTAGAEVHRRHRRLMQPMFHEARIAAYADVMAKRARALADRWTDGRAVELDTELYETAIDTLTETLFSAEISRAAADSVRVDVPVLIKYALIRAVSPQALDRLPTRANREFDAAAARLRRVIDDVISAAHRAGDAEDRVDLLSTLLAARDADTGEALSDVEVRDELVTILFAGTETTASTLSWVYHELAGHPEAEERVAEEADAIVGGGTIGFHDVAKLEYTHRVINEVTRLHAVPLLMRRATTEVELGGVRIPAGTEIAFSLYALHRDGRLYENPERFDPDRWLPERRAGLPREAHIPFGAGKRKCIGDAFAQTEIAITMATVGARWRLRPAPGHTVREVAAAVAHPDRLPMVPVAR